MLRRPKKPEVVQMLIALVTIISIALLPVLVGRLIATFWFLLLLTAFIFSVITNYKKHRSEMRKIDSQIRRIDSLMRQIGKGQKPWNN